MNTTTPKTETNVKRLELRTSRRLFDALGQDADAHHYAAAVHARHALIDALMRTAPDVMRVKSLDADAPKRSLALAVPAYVVRYLEAQAKRCGVSVEQIAAYVLARELGIAA